MNIFKIVCYGFGLQFHGMILLCAMVYVVKDMHMIELTVLMCFDILDSTCVQTPQTFTSSTEHRTSSTEHRMTVGETDISNEFAKSNVSLNENITHVTR